MSPKAIFALLVIALSTEVASAQVTPIAAPPTGPLVRSTSFELLPGFNGAPLTSVPELPGVKFSDTLAFDRAVLYSSCNCYPGLPASSGVGAALTSGESTIELSIPIVAASVYVSPAFVSVSVPSTGPATMQAYDAAGGLLGGATVQYVGSVATCGDVPTNPRQFLGLASTTPIAKLVLRGAGNIYFDDLTVSPVSEMPPAQPREATTSALGAPPSGPAVSSTSFEGLPDWQTGTSIGPFHGMTLIDTLIVDPADVYTDRCGLIPHGGAQSGTAAAFTHGVSAIEFRVPIESVGMYVAPSGISANGVVVDGIALLQAYDDAGNLLGQVDFPTVAVVPQCTDVPSNPRRFVGLQSSTPISKLLLGPVCGSNLYFDDLAFRLWRH